MNRITKPIIATLLVCTFSAYADANKPDGVLASDNGITLTTHDTKLLYDNLNPKQKIRIQQNVDSLQGFVLKLIRQRKVANKAKELDLDKTETTKLLIEVAINEVLEKQLFKQMMNSIKLPDQLEELAKEYYSTHTELFKVNEKINVSHILIQSDKNDKELHLKKLKLAKEILEELEHGLDFKEAAIKYSEDIASAKKGGSLGFFERGKMVKEFEEAAFSLKTINDLSPIIETSFGYHIIKLMDRKKAYTKDYSSVKASLIEAEKNRYIKSEFKKRWEPFNNNTNTNLYMDNLNKLLKEINE